MCLLQVRLGPGHRIISYELWLRSHRPLHLAGAPICFTEPEQQMIDRLLLDVPHDDGGVDMAAISPFDSLACGHAQTSNHKGFHMTWKAGT